MMAEKNDSGIKVVGTIEGEVPESMKKKASEDVRAAASCRLRCYKMPICCGSSPLPGVRTVLPCRADPFCPPCRHSLQWLGAAVPPSRERHARHVHEDSFTVLSTASISCHSIFVTSSYTDT
jgi:hypothetical protein